MTYEFQVITAGDSNFERLLENFNQRLQWIKQQGYRFSVSTNSLDEGKSTSISMRLQGPGNDGVFKYEDIEYIFKHQLSEVMADHIFNDWERGLLWKEIERNCKPCSQDEKTVIYEKAGTFMSKCHDSESLNLIMNYGRRTRVSRKLFEYMQENQQILIEGFINFCLRDYLNEIKFAVEVAYEELKNQKEYNDFVNLLRYFVDTQVPRIPEVNLMLGDNGAFFLWDGEGKKIDEQLTNYYLEDMLLEEINLDDVLVSILITIAPHRIVLHNTGNMEPSESVQMIRRVFKERISECHGCERCQGSGVQPLHY